MSCEVAQMIDLNSKTMTQKRVDAGQVTWEWPLVIVFSRLLFAVLAQSLVAAVFFGTSPSP